MKNVHYYFPELNPEFLFAAPNSLRRKDIQFTNLEDEEKQQTNLISIVKNKT